MSEGNALFIRTERRFDGQGNNVYCMSSSSHEKLFSFSFQEYKGGVTLRVPGKQKNDISSLPPTGVSTASGISAPSMIEVCVLQISKDNGVSTV